MEPAKANQTGRRCNRWPTKESEPNGGRTKQEACNRLESRVGNHTANPPRLPYFITSATVWPSFRPASRSSTLTSTAAP